MKVLFVTGDLRDGDFLEHEIKKVASNIQIEISLDARDAVSRLEPSASYDLVLIEASLANGDCQTLINRIRQQNLPLPIVVLVGPNDEDPPANLLAGGADDYVVKRPNYVSRMPGLLQQALERYRGRAQRRARTIRVLYAGDMENARRHLGTVPFIELEAAVVNEDGAVHRPTTPHPTSLACDLVVLEDQALGVHLLKVLKDVSSRWPDYPVVLLLAPGQEDLALQALRLGASDCIIKNGDYYARFLLSVDGLISRRDLVREKLAFRSSEERLRMVIEFVPTCVTLLSSEGTFLAMNWAGLSLVGAKHVDDIVGKNLFTLVGPPQDAQLREYVARICAGERDSIRIKWDGLDGLPRELEIRAVPLRRDPNGTTAALAVMQDASQVTRGEDTRDLQERCERLSQALREAETGRREIAEQKRNAEEALATAEVRSAEAAAQREGERVHWESMLKELRQQLQSADERKTMLEEALLAAKSRCSELTEGHQAELAQLEMRMADIERRAQASRNEKDTLEEILHELEGKHEEFVRALREEKRQAETGREELARRLAEVEEQRNAAEAALAAAQASAAEVTARMDAERVEWQALRRELEEGRDNAEAQAAFVNALLRSAEERYGSLRESFNAENARWEAARQESERQQVELLAQRKAMDAEKRATELRLSEALAAAESGQSRIAAERKDLELQRQAAEERERIAEEQVQRFAEELRAAEARAAESAAALDGERNAWEAARAELAQRANAAAAQVAALEESLKGAQSSRSELAEGHRAAENRWEQERSELENRLRSAEGEREALREASRAVQSRLDEVIKGFETERSHWLTAREQLESRCQGLEELESTRSQMLHAAEAKLADLSVQLQAERGAWSATRQGLDQKIYAAVAQQQALHEALREERARRGSLEESLAAAEKRAAELNDRNEIEKGRWEAIRQELEQKVGTAESEKAAVEESLRSAQVRCEELAAQLQAEKNQHASALSDFGERLRSSEEGQAPLAAELQVARAARDGLSEQLRLKSDEFQSALRELETQKAETERLRQLQRETIARHQELIRKWSSDFEHALTSTVARCQQEEEERIQKMTAQQRAEREGLEEQLARVREELRRLETESSGRSMAEAVQVTLEKQLAQAQVEFQRLAEAAGSEKRSLEAELNKLSARHRNLIEGGLVAHALTTPDGRLLACNDAFARILGHESARNVITACPEMLKPVVDQNGGQAGRLSDPGAAIAVRCSTRRADGRPTVLEGYAGPAVGIKGEPPRLEWFFSGVTDRRELDEELRRGQRMEAVGRLASEVAPTLNDLLTSIEGLYGQLLATDAGRAARRDLADRMAKETSRARRLAHQLWMFSQKQERKPEILDLNSLMKDQEAILRRLTGEDIDLYLNLDPEPQRVSMVRQELDRALTTLAVITRDTLPAGGTVTIETRSVQLVAADERLGEGLPPGAYVQLTVSALGLGARSPSGISTLEEIIRRSGGSCRASITQKSESTIQLFLPRIAGEQPTG